MPQIIRPQLNKVTTNSGTVSFNVPCRSGYIEKIYVLPATLTTTYDIRIVDRLNYQSFERQDLSGEYVENGIKEPLFGNITVTIANASADEVFEFLIVINDIS